MTPSYYEIPTDLDPITIACAARERWRSIFFYKLPDFEGQRWYLLAPIGDSLVCTGNGVEQNGLQVPLERLDSLLERYADHSVKIDRDSPFDGGLLMVASFEFYRIWNQATRTFFPADRDTSRGSGELQRMPLAIFCEPKSYLLISPTLKVCRVVGAELYPPITDPLQAEIEKTLVRQKNSVSTERTSKVSPFPLNTYSHRFRNAGHYFTAGEVYQLITSATLRFELQEHRKFTDYAAALANSYEAARFGYMFSYGDTTVIGFCSLPHSLVEHSRISTDVFAGTLPAAVTDDQLAAHLKTFREDSGFLAEHIMLVDMERNELNQICHPTSVRVDAHLSTRTVGSTTYLSSTVSGTLDPQIALWSVPLGAIPRGVVSGAPKKRACEVISTIEGVPRSWYGGAIGVIDRTTRSIVSNCIITCSMLADLTLSIPVGSGVLVDSNFEEELTELSCKAELLIKAALGVSARAVTESPANT